MKLRNYSKVCSCISIARDQDDNTKVMGYPGNTYCRRVKNYICTILKKGLDKASKWLLSFIFKSKFTHTCDGTSHPCLHAVDATHCLYPQTEVRHTVVFCFHFLALLTAL